MTRGDYSVLIIASLSLFRNNCVTALIFWLFNLQRHEDSFGAQRNDVTAVCLLRFNKNCLPSHYLQETRLPNGI